MTAAMGNAESRIELTTFGELLRHYRLAAALSQEALAERASLSADAVRAIERGRRTPRPDTVARLAEALALTAAQQQQLIATVQSAAAPAEMEVRRGGTGTRHGIDLIGRTNELALLEPLLETSLAGEHRTILLSGTSGVGKSRLAQEIGRRARERGFLLAEGRCFEAEQSVPYLPFRSAFVSLYRAAPAELQHEAGSRWPYLAPLLPDLVPGTRMQGTGDEQSRVLFAAAGYLAAMTEHVPAVLLLDDLHWADLASLRLLRYLATHACSCRLVILGTYVPEFVTGDHPFSDVVRDLSREATAEHITVPPLDAAETATLVTSILQEESQEGTQELVPSALSALVHDRTGGNPFFVHQIVKTLVERGELQPLGGKWTWNEIAEDDVPETVRAVIGQRVRRLPETAQNVLAAASVLGQSFWAGDLAAMAPRPEDEMEDGLDAAEGMGLIRETDRGRYEFDHALTQRALYGEIPSRRRRRLHRAAAEAIASLPEHKRTQRAGELARHFLEGDRPAEALPYAVLAGDQAESVFAHEEAEQHYHLALRLAEEAGDEATVALACTKLAAPFHRTSRFTEALELLERAATRYEKQDDIASLVPVMGAITAIHSDRGSAEEGLARLAPLLPRLTAQPATPALIHLLVSYGSLLFVVGRRREHLTTSRRAVELASGLGDVPSRAAAEAQLGLALLSVRQRVEAREALDRAIALAEVSGDLITLGLALNNAAFLAEVWGEFARSRELSRRGFELAQRLGDPSQTAFMATALGRNHFYSGEWQEARQWHERALEIGREVSNSWVAPYLVLGYSQLLMAQGEEDAAERALQQGLTLAENNVDVQARELAVQLWGELDLQREAPQRAWARLSQYGITASWDPEQDNLSLPAALVLARVLMALQRAVEAEAVVSTIVTQARLAGERLVLAEALALQAVLAREAGKGEAEASFAEALTLVQSIGYPYLEGRIRYECSVLFPERREAELQAARAIFERLGAHPYLDEARTHIVRRLAGRV